MQAGGGGLFSVAGRWTAARPARVEPAPTGISGGHGERVRRKSHVGAGSARDGALAGAAHAESCDARHTAIAGRTRSHRVLRRAGARVRRKSHVGAGSARDGALAGAAHAESCDAQHTAIAGRTRSHRGAPRAWFNQAPWHFLNFFSLPQGQGSLRPTSFNALRVGSWGA